MRFTHNNHKYERHDMDTEKVKALLQTLEDGNLSTAADKLGYTPSGMSRMMVALEEEIGLKLLHRDRHGVKATRECEELLPQMKQLIRADQSMSERIAELSGAIVGQVRVATAYSVLYGPLARIVRDFGELHPGVSVFLGEGISTEILNSVESHDIDFGIISARESDCEWTTLVEDEFYAWVPSDHPAVKIGKYDMKNFETDPVIELFPGIESDTSILFKEKGIKPNIRYSTSDAYASYSMVEAGLGVTTSNGLFNGMWSGSVVAVPLDPPVMIKIGIVTSDEKNISPASKLFRDYATPRILDFINK